MITLDLSYNNFSRIPFGLIANLTSLENLYFQHNRLTEVPLDAFKNIERLQVFNFSNNNLSSIELWTFLINGSVDFRNNAITTVTNNGNFDFSGKKVQSDNVYLSGNGPLSLNDGVYEMYGTCSEIQFYLNDTDLTPPPDFTFGLFQIDYGTTRLECSCDVYYLINIGPWYSGDIFASGYLILNASCVEGNQTLFEFNTKSCVSSSTNFSTLVPRLCKINDSEPGSIPVFVASANNTDETVS